MDRCALCPNVNACIPPDGPEDADILFIGEAPGPQEDKNAKKHPPGLPFIGKTGDEVNRHYLPLASLRRSAVRFINAISCLPVSAGGKLDPNRSQDIYLLNTCAERFLHQEILRGRYSLLVPMGAFACRAVFGEAFDLELKHGIPQETPWGITAFPMYHPALGIHEPKKMLYIRTDWDRLGKYLRGVLHVPMDDYPEPDYAEVSSPAEIRDINPDEPLAADTEFDRERRPFCLTYSQWPGVGRLIRAERADLLSAFNQHVRPGKGPILFHNWFADQPITQAMGLQLEHRRIVDTLVRVFNLGNLPQGLKALALRELGMTMEDFDDLVTPYSRYEVIKYYYAASQIQWPKPEEGLELDETSGLWKLKKPQGMNTKLKRFFTDLDKARDTKDVFKAWDNWEAEQTMMEAQLGPWPGKDIRHVPFEKILYYACRDSDALIRLGPILKRMTRVVRRYSQEHWRERVA